MHCDCFTPLRVGCRGPATLTSWRLDKSAHSGALTCLAIDAEFSRYEPRPSARGQQQPAVPHNSAAGLRRNSRPCSPTTLMLCDHASRAVRGRWDDTEAPELGQRLSGSERQLR